MTIDAESFAALHKEFPNTFPDTPPKPVQRPRSLFRTEIEPATECDDPPAFSDFPAIVGFLPFLEPALGNPILAKHPTYRKAVLLPFVQAMKDAAFLYPLQLSADSTEVMPRSQLDWIGTAVLDDLRRLMCRTVCQNNAIDLADAAKNGVIQTILKRFRDAPRTPIEELSLLILSFDPMGIDYGYEDEYKPQAAELLQKLPLCGNENAALTMICDVFQRWFRDNRPREEYGSLPSSIWSWFQAAKGRLSIGQPDRSDGAETPNRKVNHGNAEKSQQPTGHGLTEQQADELNRLFSLGRNKRQVN